jgi:hypothetical protein
VFINREVAQRRAKNQCENLGVPYSPLRLIDGPAGTKDKWRRVFPQPVMCKVAGLHEVRDYLAAQDVLTEAQSSSGGMPVQL